MSSSALGPTVSDPEAHWGCGAGGHGRGSEGRDPRTLGHQQDLLRVSPGAVENTSSLLTYDSWSLVNNFLYQSKHDYSFQPLFPEETVPDPRQAAEAAELCGDNDFCIFDVMATGSLSVGNATRMAHQGHQHRVQSLQPGEGDGVGTGCWDVTS